MIFVTVGTWQFDELVKTVDRAVEVGLLEPEVIIQIGSGSYEPLHCKYFRSATSLHPYYDQAGLVVAHGGTGTTFEVLSRGLSLISVANPHVQDNHQHEFLAALEDRGYLRYCRNVKELPELIRAGPLKASRSWRDVSPWASIAEEIDRVQPVVCANFRMLRRWALNSLSAHRIAEDSVELIRTPGPTAGP